MALNWDRARKQALEIDKKYNTARSVTPGASSGTAYVPGTSKYTAAANITPKRTVTALPNAGTPTADRARLGLATGGNPVMERAKEFVKREAPWGKADFGEKSAYQSTANGREEKLNLFTGKYTETGFDDILYDAINGNKTARSRLLNTDTARSYDLDSLTADEVSGFNYLYATRGAEAAYNYLDKAAGQTYTGAEAVALGALEATGLSSLSAAIGGGISRLTGDGEMAERNSRWYNGLTADAAAAQEQHPAAYGAGSVGGNLALMYGTGAALGAVEGALSAGAGIGGKTVQLTLSPAVQSIVNGALTFAAADAVQNAGSAATGRITGTDYLKSLGISGAQGMAGGAAGSLVGSGLADVLRKSGLQTPFMEFARQTAQGFASAGANIGTGYALSEEKPTKEQVTTDLATAFLLSVLQSGISTYRTTAATRAQLEQAVEAVGEQYGRMSRGWERMTPEARARAAENILRQTRALRSELNSTYLAGQQSTVNQMNAALDGIEAAMQGYVSGFSGAPAAAPGRLPGAAAPASPSGSGSGVEPGLVPVSRLAGGVTGQPASPLPAGAAAAMAPAKPTARQNNTASTVEAASTAVDTNPARHTAAEQAVIDAYQAAVDDNLANFVETALENKGSNRGKYTLKPVSARATADIKALTGIDTSGFKTVLEQRIAEHIVERHGANGAADTSMQDINDIARMQYVLDNYDSMEPAGYTRAYTTNKPNGRPGQAKTVKYIKAVNGTYYIIEAVPDTKAKTTFIVSAYMSNKKAGESQTTDANAPAWTAKPENATTPALISIISENPAGGNARSARNRAGVTAVGDEYLQQELEEAWNGADGPSVRGPQEDGIHNAEQPRVLDSIRNAGYDNHGIKEDTEGLSLPTLESGNEGKVETSVEEGIANVHRRAAQENKRSAGLRAENQGRTQRNGEAEIGDGTGRAVSPSERYGRIDPTYEQVPVRSWVNDGLIAPRAGSIVGLEQQTAMEYGIPSFVVSDTVWEQNKGKTPAFSAGGQIFLRETLPEEGRGTYVPHEVTHVMKQVGYQPYLEFIQRTPDMLNLSSVYTRELLKGIAEHRGIFTADITAEQAEKVYDELNATIYGSIAAGEEGALELVRPAFEDFDAYAAELLEIHRQFKEQRSRSYPEELGAARPGEESLGERGGKLIRGSEPYDEFVGNIQRMLHAGAGTTAQAVRTGQEDNVQRALEEGWRDEEASVRGPEGEWEGEVTDRLRRAAKSIASGGRVVGFEGLPGKNRSAFQAGLAKAAPEAGEVLKRVYRAADYQLSSGKRSYYRGMSNVVEISRDAEASTLAHELFHQLDADRRISSTLMEGLIQDYVALSVQSGGDIKGYLVKKYPKKFRISATTGENVLYKEYRGISDILNGLSGGKIEYGYGHSPEYWSRSGKLEAEAWAQFGRMQYENNPEVLKMLSEFFPNFARDAMMALKGLV